MLFLLDPKDSLIHFTHMLYCDVLVTSRSGFSFIPAELGDSVVIVAQSWLKYNRQNMTIYPNLSNGTFDTNLFKRLLKQR